MVCKVAENKKPKLKHRKGLWSPEEDQKLRNYVLVYGHGCWSSVPVNAGLQRNGKSCRLRWINYLRPGLKRGMFTVQEEDTILSLHSLLGNKWSQIAQHLPGRTDNEIKNHWHSYLKKKVTKADQETTTDEEPNQSQSTSESLTSGSPSPHISPHFDMSKSTNYSSSLPKVFFAEWLMLDHDHHQGMQSNETPIREIDALDFSSNLIQNHNQIFVHDNFYSLANVNNVGGGYHMLSDGSASELCSSEIKLKDQDILAGSGFFMDCISRQDICSEFHLNSDVNAMYL